MTLRGWVMAVVAVVGSSALLSLTADAARPRQPLVKAPLSAAVGPHRVVVKFIDSAAVRMDNAATRSDGHDLASLHALVQTRGLSLTPMFPERGHVQRLTARALHRSGRAQPDLLGMFEVRGASLEDARALQALQVVEFVSISAVGVPPPVDIAPPTPDLQEFQGYLGPDPGVDAIGAWAMGFRGESVGLADVEYAWRLEHEEWNEGALTPEPNQTPDLDALGDAIDGNHGTSVAGVLIAGDNGYGVTGIAPSATLRVYSELTVESGPRRAEAIVSAASSAAPGDVVLLEMQVPESLTGLLGPAEIDEAVWVATRMAADAGVVIVAAAGNGALDLDREELAYYRERGDSGAIIVGAGQPGTRERLGFSTYGERVDLQGWGQDVFTTGYGQFAMYGDDANQSYTAVFNGTSSASPVVAGVAALAQGAVKDAGGEPLTSEQMRAVLRGTGLPQPLGDEGRLGPLPQAPAAIEAALLPPTEPPSVTISAPASTHTEELSLVTTIEVAASGDTAFVQLLINGELQPVVDEVPPFTFAEVVFPPGTWEVVAVATNIWDVEANSDGVVLEVGWTPPAGTTTDADQSTGVSVGVGTGGGTGDDTTSGPTPDPGSTGTVLGGSNGGETAGSSPSGGGCGIGGSPGASCLALLGLWAWRRRHSRPSRSSSLPLRSMPQR
ncbi:MAG: S8 family serine peptidase [Nannocystaceae bacterium]|nr:S8 family serine peptidase [Nannocystaceae bacterium]